MRYQPVLVLGFLTAIATQAQSASLKTFEAGERVKAAEVNGNFEYLEQKINPLVNDSAPTIEVLNFGYDSSIAKYTGDLIISDDTDLFRIKIQIGRLYVPVDFEEALGTQDIVEYMGYYYGDSDEHGDEHGEERYEGGLNWISNYWPAPSTKEVRILGAAFAPEPTNEEGPV